MTGWRVPLRIARREATRAKGRSILMLVMIALPVMGVTAADILIQTQDVSSAESLDRRLGTQAAAKVFGADLSGDASFPRSQSTDPERGWSGSSGSGTLPVPGLDDVLTALGGQRTGIEVVQTYPHVETSKGSSFVPATEVDLRDPLAQGLFDLVSGTWPRTKGEVVINQALVDRGPALGDTITVTMSDPGGGEAATFTRKVVGIAESTSYRSIELIAGPPGSMPEQIGEESSWLIGGPPVSWDGVQAVNAIGALVVSRDVVLHPNVEARAAEAEFNDGDGIDEATVTVAVLVVVMALIEVVLLAGPAFAVGARRQARPLALLAASGGTPQQARRVILATGIVIGTAGAIAGVLLGIGGARALEPVLQHYNGSWFGPFQVPWLHLFGVAAFGFLSAVLAAVVPAWIASRQDVVAVLAGRRGDRKPSGKSPFFGLALLGLGIALAGAGTETVSSTSAILIALSAILCVLGMLLLVPVVVVGVARLGRHLPLALRFAVRDAARHRSRTTPAIAAVAATVAGVVAFGIGTSSDAERQEALYQPVLPAGTASISADFAGAKEPDWDAFSATVAREADDVAITPVAGVVRAFEPGSDRLISFSHLDGNQVDLGSYGGSLGTDMLVYDGTVPGVLVGVEGFDAARAKRILDSGGIVAFSDSTRPLPRAEVRVETLDMETGEPSTVVTREVDSVAFHLATMPPTSGIIPAELARDLGFRVATVGLVVEGPISKAQEKDLQESLTAMTPGGNLYVERGYEASSDTLIMLFVLAGLGAVLMLGGTLTATFLALSDARPDLATLSAVGAAPRTRRAVAAAYALAVGGIGAVLGVLVGFVPGIAVTYPITSTGWNPCNGDACALLPDHFLAVPWLLIGGVVVVLPLLVAGVVWVFARSRLPLVARLS